MKKLFAATVSVAALYGASAFAADMPMKAPVYKAAAPGYNWTGWYGGVNVGVGGSQTFTSTPNSPGEEGSLDLGAPGFAGGVQAGYNWQLAPQWVFGVEGDIGYLGIKRSFTDLDEFHAFGVKTDWYATLRGRFGYTNGPSLFYATGGAAFVNVRNNFDRISLPPITFVSKYETAAGWAAGAGIETMLGGNWSAKAEYLYIDAGDQSVNSPSLGIGNAVFENRFHLYRYGLNYKFGGPAVAPVVLPAHSWTGLYAGVNAGVGLSQDIVTTLVVPPFGTSFDMAGSGFIGGVQMGYNWQLAPNWVAGIEGDIGYLGIKRSFLEWNEVGTSFSVKADWYSTLRGRIGYSTGPALLYITGGAAFVNVRNNVDNFPIASVPKSETATGWTVGGGIEAALAQNWTAKTEYLYIDAGNQDLFNPNISLIPFHFDSRFHVFRFGVNYQFNAAAMAPVAARY